MSKTPPTASTLERLLDDHYGNQVCEKLMDWLLEKEKAEVASRNLRGGGYREDRYDKTIRAVREAFEALGYDRREREAKFERTVRRAPSSVELVSLFKQSRFNPKD
jgi:hypothetical protein